MLLPTQQTQGLAATNLMQSMLDGMEENRKRQEEERTGEKRDPLAEARIGASIEAQRAREKISEALFGSNGTDANALKIQLIERLATKLGIDTDEARSSYKLGRALEDVLKTMDPAAKSKLEDELGLKEIGVSIDTLLAAIKNPYGDDNARLMEGLTKKANGGKLGTEIERVVQRLEDVADPKTLEELKLGPQGYDPTRIEDEATRAERQDDIKAAEASEKLEDVKEMQDAVEERNDAAPSHADDPDAPSTGGAETLVILAAAADRLPENAEDEATGQIDGDATSNPASVSAEAPVNEIAARMAEAIIEMPHEQPLDVLSISIDDIGLYELLKERRSA